MTRGRVRPTGPNEVAVTCWCEAVIVYVPSKWIAQGRTKSCGLRKCGPNTDKERW